MSKGKQRRFWSTLQEYEDAASVEQLKKEEFFAKPAAVIKEDNSIADAEEVASPSRRDFIKLSGAAAVLSMVSCERPVEKILPYVNAPEDVIPGVANYYASSSDEANSSILVKTREGRPINVMPNDLDKVSGKGLNARAYASVVDLYDPGRATSPLKLDRKGGAKEYAFEDADLDIAEAIEEATGKVVLLTGTLNGPSRDRLIKDLSKSIDKFSHVMVDAASNDQLRMANKKSFGTENLAHYDFAKAKSIVFLGGDAVADGRDTNNNVFGIAENRRVIQTNEMSRLFAFEPTITETGLNVDYRYAVKNEDMAFVAMAIAHELVNKLGVNGAGAESALSNYSAAVVEKKLHLKSGTIHFVAKSLKANAGASIIYAEGAANITVNGEALHIAVNYLNSILGNVGKTIDYSVNNGKQSRGSMMAFESLIKDMESGAVSVLLLHGTNPAYFYPDKARLSAAFAKVGTLVSMADRIDETTEHFDFLLTSTHSFESWGDREYINGNYSIVQPTIRPLWDNRQFETSLITIANEIGASAFKNADGSMMSYYDYVRETWKGIHKSASIAASFERFWVTVVRDGLFDSVKNRTSYKAEVFNASALQNSLVKSTSEKLTLSVFIGSTKADGRQGNNAYLMEAPDPVSKVTWDNFLALAPDTAKELGLWINDLAEISVNGQKVTVPVNIQPGMHKSVATLAAGWGRTNSGLVGDGERDENGTYKGQGVNAFSLTQKGHFSGHEFTISKLEGDFKLADTQGHQYMDDKQRFVELHDHHKENYRPIIFETSLAEYQEDPSHVVKYHTDELTKAVKDNKIDNLWNVSTEDVHKYPGHRWGMVIDMNSCVGCNACVVACQIENNIPVVGKSEVLLGREMHWMRIDRYYVGSSESPEVVTQPMFCQHCTNAPCETVCPVVATTHNQEGLNVMTYNRCVGTRYCANNCPYKVRRFNFHEYTKGDATKGAPGFFGLGSDEASMNKKDYDLSAYPMQLMLNPDVTVREKGVMEKCSMCSHKLREAKYEAKMQGTSINDLDNASTACETACPANAITFGDMNDKDSKLAKLKESPLNFASLAELNTKPAVSYVSVVRNQDEPYWKSAKSETEEH
jgi:molybdopterin-containing oxidoreductase family iron-sulfur binding subunit